MKHKIAKFIVLLFFVLIFVVACSNASQPGTLEAINVNKNTFIITRQSENFFPGDLVTINNGYDFSDLQVGKIYGLQIKDEIATTVPPSATISEINEDLGQGLVNRINFSQVATLKGLFSENTKLIDVRKSQDFSKGHISSSINIPLEDFKSSIEKEVPNKEDLLIIFADKGRKSEEACQIALDLGYKLVFDCGDISFYSGDLIEN